MYVYVQSEPRLFTVGHFDPSGNWHSDSDHPSRETAAQRVAWLNGSPAPPETSGTPQMEPCGYCRGNGMVPASQYDREGRHHPDRPTQVTCEYCGGSGECEDGRKLLPARKL